MVGARITGLGRLLAAAALAVLTSVAIAQAPDPLGLNPDSARHGRYVSVGISNEGLPLIAHQDQSSEAGMTVTRCFDAQCTARSTGLLDPRGSGNAAGVFSRLSIAPDGQPIIVHLKFGSGAGVRLYRCGAADCSQSMVNPDSVVALGVDGLTPVSVDAAVGPDNMSVISTFLQLGSSGQGLWILKCSDPACLASPTATQVNPTRGESGRLSAIAVGADGLPVVAFQDRSSTGSNGNLAVMKCNDAACSGQDESTVILDPLGGSIDRPIDLTLNAAGHPVIALAGPSGFLRVITCNDPACVGGDEQSHEVVTEAGVGFAIAIALDSRGFPVIAAHGFPSTNRSLEVISCNDAFCAGDDELTSARLIPDAADITFGRYLDLVVASNGEPFLVYTREQRISSSQVVTSARVASCVSATCIDLFKDGFE